MQTHNISNAYRDYFSEQIAEQAEEDEVIYCGACGSKLHIATNTKGDTFLLSRGGSTRCPWPNPPTQRHFVSARRTYGGNLNV